MIKKLFNFVLFISVIFSVNSLNAQTRLSFGKYHTKDEVQQILTKLQKDNAFNTRLISLATSPGGNPVKVLEIGTNLKDVPAIFVGANFEGNIPISSEAALFFARMLLDSAQYTTDVKWYIMPQPNPDAGADFFASVKTGKPVNEFEMNNDADNGLDEDDFDDLNGDGYITQMRVKDPEGKYIASLNDPRFLNIADVSKGERGEYKVYTEGIDNDKDGNYNEDGKGGINVGIAFPHLFPRSKKEAGLYSGQTPEVYGILRFIYDHPEIAMVYTLGSSDFCSVPPKGGRKGGADLNRIKIPGRYARMLNADVSKTYTMDEVITLMQPQMPAGMELTPSTVAGILNLGAAVNPLDGDLKFYKSFAEEYKKYLQSKKFDTETLAPGAAKDGSFELWAYYHLGVPSFSMNLFTVPKVKEEKKKNENTLSAEEVEKMKTSDFIALGEEKIESFLKLNNAPEQYNAKRIIKMMESGKITPGQLIGKILQSSKSDKEGELSEKDKSLLAWSEKHWNGKGFVTWEKVKHPDFEEVEIGGFIPYLETSPKPELIDSLAKVKLPWLLKLSDKLPEIKISDSKITDLGANVYKLEIFVENKGVLPYPIEIGIRNSQPAPVVIVLEGTFEILEGTQRKPLGAIGGNQLKKLSWIIKSDKKTTISAKLESAVFADDVKQINIGG